MPTVRRYGQQQVTPAPLPAARRRNAPTAASEGALVGEAVAQVGGQVGTVGLRLFAEQQRQARQEADDARLVGLDRQLGELQLQQEMAATELQGPAALAFLDTATQQFDVLAGRLQGELTPRLRPAFERQRDRRRASLREAIGLTGSRKMDAYAQREREGELVVARQGAIVNADNPRRIAEELARTRLVIARMPGLGAEARAAMTAEHVSAIHEGVIDTHLARGEDKKARWYYDEVRPQLRAEALPAFEQKLASASTAAEGLRAAEAIWLQHGPKADADPIHVDRMEEAARAQFRDDPDALKATIAFLRERKAGVDMARKDRTEAIAGGLWRAVNEGASLDQIRRMPAYVNAPGGLQLQVAEHLVQRDEQRAARAFTAAGRREAEQEQAGFAMLWHFDRPEILGQMTTNQILALTPDLGRTHVETLLTKQRTYAASAAEVRAATVDAEAFKAKAHAAGLQPYASDLTETQKAQLGFLQNAVEAAIDAEQQHRKRPLTRDEKDAVADRLIDRQVLIDRWGGGPRPAAAVVTPKDRAAAYVPLDQIPEHSLSEWVNVIRSQSPSAQRLSRAEILRRWRDRIQRAHAAAVLGLGAEEERRRLEGR